MTELITYESYQPSKIQMKAHLSSRRYKLFGGAMNCGKSFWLCAEAIRLSLMFPGNVGVLARYRFRDLKKTTLPILLQMIPQQFLRSYNKTEGLIEFINGSKIYCSDLEDPNKIKSMNLGWFGIDEATDVPNDEAFNMLTTRLRLIIKGIKYFGLLATNPEPGWVKDKWISEPTDDFAFFPALPKDNPAYSQAYVDDVARNLPPSLRARYLEGSWDSFDDSIFKPEWIYPGIDSTGNYWAKITFVDTAISEKKQADESAICTVGIEYLTGFFHELETVSGRWTFDELKKNCESAYLRHKPNHFYVEAVQSQVWLAQELRQHHKIPAKTYRPDRDKIQKSLLVQDLFEQGRVRTNTPKLQKQAIDFPNGTHDDLIDAFISCLLMFKLNNMTENKKPEGWILKHKKNRRVIGDNPKNLVG
ncbi:MAG: phage terminase large subunit [Alphaproteobacteria bacterium]|nr:phage terminase large subunit [Alphaproteobacteria bacterium]